ncbi:hypothetical protein [Paracoccus shanxieyensis]|uniref:Uncharacterized protein n=1 Tax=Paracoccus shanxieyensis TaxID=2675752 RepID=A0A6L6J2A2_9RHOB|nr:hypothetical protein [Paracoccus shanxieyensis]MTH64847.1 hypothetical protein [Paracoccus shanxieyensis]MTH87920.1 hypothetical protein [Paracoccus shanxieyensis]
MNNPDPHRQTPPPRQAGRGAVVIIAIVVAVIVAIFVLRQFWHADEQQEDPASISAPAQQGEGQAPAEQ